MAPKRSGSRAAYAFAGNTAARNTTRAPAATGRVGRTSSPAAPASSHTPVTRTRVFALTGLRRRIAGGTIADIPRAIRGTK